GRLLPVGTHQPPRRRRPAPTDPRPHLAGRGAAVGTAASRTQPSASAVPGAPALAAVVGNRGPSAYRRPFVGLPVWCHDTAAAVVAGGSSVPELRVHLVDEERAWRDPRQQHERLPQAVHAPYTLSRRSAAGSTATRSDGEVTEAPAP